MPCTRLDETELVVYTAIYGDRDLLWEPSWQADGVELVAFSDQPRSSDSWQTVTEPGRFSDPCRSAKWYKLHPQQLFPRAQASLWIDGSYLLVSDPRPTLDALKTDLGFPVHPWRRCAYKEARVCIKWDKDKRSVIERQVARYRSVGFPENFGLVEANAIFRRHTEATRRFDTLWWQEIQHGSRRDQISLPFTFWRLGLPYDVLPKRLKGVLDWKGHKSRYV